MLDWYFMGFSNPNRFSAMERKCGPAAKGLLQICPMNAAVSAHERPGPPAARPGKDGQAPKRHCSAAQASDPPELPRGMRAPIGSDDTTRVVDAA